MPSANSQNPQYYRKGLAMEQSKTSTRVLLTSAVILLFVLITGPLGHKYQLTDLGPAITSVLIAVVGGVLVLLVSLVMLAMAMRRQWTKDKSLLLMAIVLSLVPLGLMAPNIIRAGAVPEIHDISTDTDNPPMFDAVVALREGAANDLIYGTTTLSPEQHAELQHEAYPQIQTKLSPLTVLAAVSRAESILAGQGLQIVSVNPEAGLVEATATTFWFGFKDDLVVRIGTSDNGSKVDVRSVSRVGGSDLGANAARIERFLLAF